jgi:phosphonate transport system substrate-binding protein
VAAAASMLALPMRAPGQATLRIGLTPVFLDDQARFLADWRHWLEDRLSRGVEFVQRGNYRDVVDLVRSRKLNCAWVCGYPYVRFRQELALLCTPLWKGTPFYRSYIIVGTRDGKTQSLAELRGRVFAYSDPDSNSGCLYPRYALVSRGEVVDRFFSRTFFTWSHRNVVEAVATGLAAGGAVDGYVWETLREFDPALVDRTRVIERSGPFGHPPFVVHRDHDPVERELLRGLFTRMAGDDTGSALLHRLRLDGFTNPDPVWYDDIARMAERVGPL